MNPEVMNLVFDRISRHKKIILCTVVVLSLLSLWSLRHLTINPDVFSNLPKDDPVAVFFNRVGEEYGGNYLCVIGLESENVFTAEMIRQLIDIQDSIRYIEGVGSVSSLANILDIREGEYGIEIGPLIDVYDPPVLPEQIRELREYVLSDDLYRGRLVSEDGTMLILAVRLAEGSKKIEVSGRIEEMVRKMYPGTTKYYGGQPAVIHAFGKSINRDLLVLGPFCLLMILVVLAWGFRKAEGVYLPVLTVLLGILWTFGLMGALKIEISIITSVIPILLIAIGSAYTIHVYNRLTTTPPGSREEILSKALSSVALPVFFTALTTILGFLSFIFGSYLHMIRIFGIFTSAGIFFSLVLSLFFIPGCIRPLPHQTSETIRKRGRFSLSLFLEKMAGRIIRRPGRILLFWAVLLATGISGITRIERKVDFIEYFRKNDPNRQTENILKEKIGGTFSVYVSVKGDVLNPEVLQAVSETQKAMARNPHLIHSQSVADLIIRMNDVMGEGARIPEERNKVENLWFLLEGQEILDQLVSKDRQEAMIQASFNSSDIKDAKAFIGDMEQYFSTHHRDTFRYELSGYPSLIVRLDESLIKSQFQSLGLAILLIFLTVSLLQSSLKKGALSMIPILSTLILLYGFMGWTGIPLDIATVLVGSASIGIGIDYAIHISHHLSRSGREGYGTKQRIQHAVCMSGKAIIINMLSVIAGFMVLVFSSLIPLVRFGLLVSFTMLASGSASLSLLPAIYALIDKQASSPTT